MNVNVSLPGGEFSSRYETKTMNDDIYVRLLDLPSIWTKAFDNTDLGAERTAEHLLRMARK